MPAHSDTQTSPHGAEQLFNLVADVARYPEFLPWCRAARIMERKDGEMLAELMIAFSHFTERYTSLVTLEPYRAIQAEMVKGPFEHLINQWRFYPLEGGGTRIEFFLDFKFRSKLMENMIGGLFAKAAEKMVQAFRDRADALYGAAPPEIS